MFTCRRGIVYAATISILVIPVAALTLIAWAGSVTAGAVEPGPAEPTVAPAAPEPTPAEPLSAAALEELARTDPSALTRLARQRYERDVRNYRCVLIKQERLGGKLTPVQKIEVRYRSNPEFVYMIWKENLGEVRRALYGETPEFRDRKGRRVAKVEPAGAIVRLFVDEIMIQIDGEEARRASRRCIADCGFRGTFRLLEDFNAAAQKRGHLDFRYAGEGVVDGRPTFIFERLLPDLPEYPDEKMILHVDQEYLLPVAVLSYEDREGKVLLGSYHFTSIQINPPMDDGEFKF